MNSVAWLWVGWSLQKISGGLPLYVVAIKPGSSLAFQVHLFPTPPPPPPQLLSLTHGNLFGSLPHGKWFW